MEHLNYCRQMTKQFSTLITDKSLPEEYRGGMRHAIDLAAASQKFLLPEGGRLYDDKELRALDESEELRLPYPVIALEYSRRFEPVPEGCILSTKAIVLAREMADAIALMPVFWIDHLRTWVIIPEVAIPTVGYLNRATKLGVRPEIIAYYADDRIPCSTYSKDLGVLFCFLNVLQCNNVHVERSKPKKNRESIKAAFPFDTYHVLAIDVLDKRGNSAQSSGNSAQNCGHCGPREHLRRGHIRRLAGGRRIWVNATIVAAGRGAGAVKKDYSIRQSYE